MKTETTKPAARNQSSPEPVQPSKSAWYQQAAEAVLSQLGTTPAGLNSDAARQRLAQYGYNELSAKKRSAFVRFMLQFHNAMIYILLAAAFVTGVLLHEVVDTCVILGVVILNVIIGFIQEGKAEAAIEALKKMIVAESTVLRDGRKQVIPTREVVPGDIVLLEGGNRVPADVRLFQVKNFYADEAPLTGESVPVNKHTEPVHKEHLGPGDQRNMAFSGTFITRGAGQGVVTSTGRHTEFGKIAEMMKETHKIITPLTRKINEFTRFLIIAILIIAGINFALGVFFKFPVGYSFLASVALAVAAIPEMLPAIVVAILALASTAMARRNALIRKLPAAETLGCASVICSDKTGTLTRNEMTVVRLFAGGSRYRVTGAGYEPKGEFTRDGQPMNITAEPPEVLETLRAAAWCNHAVLEENAGRFGIVGDPTEGALVVAAAKARLSEYALKLDEIPFESENRYMATLHENSDHNLIFIKGSPETVLSLCVTELVGGQAAPLRREAVLAEADDMAREALRVLGMACKRAPKTQTSVSADDLDGLTFLGLTGMIDPPRIEVIEAVKQCRTAGIRVVMITGDHAVTARAIAREIGIISGDDGVLTGEDLARMSDEQLYEAAGRVSVYARSAPEHKLRICQQLQKRGNIVAMTGDGVNDAPALKAADIGVAMGITGTEVSKESADMVLADDNFASIVNAVEEGRHAWKNFQKAVLYTLPTNGGQALMIMGAVLLAPLVALFSIRLPLEPIHILWVNLADSVFLTLPLMMEPKEKGLLNDAPRNPNERIANRLFFERVGLVSILMAATGFGVYYYFGAPALAGVADGGEVNSLLLTQAQTAAFISIQLLHLGFLATARSIYNSAFTFSFFSNPWVLLGMGLTVGSQLLIVYVPFLQTVFRTAAFPVEWWLIIGLGLFPGFIAVELEKYIRRRFAAQA
ncbi:MAG TPA: HAD-IC family P-type ATPase [Candidatus Paceibacterota bacterium]|nr:HAD-IC family P-type ATPase [Candidatus Paceibacterota bacterium]